MSREAFVGNESWRPFAAEEFLSEPEALRRLLESRGVLAFANYASGLFPASSISQEMAEATGMGKAWLRDNAHVANALYTAGESSLAVPAGQALLNVLSNNRPILDGIVDGSLDPTDPQNRLPVRVDGNTLENYPEPRVQNDSVGYALWLTCRFMLNGSLRPRRQDLETIAQTVRYLDTIQYWHDPDDGHWEEDRLIHASSVGAIMAGLREARALFDRIHYHQGIDFGTMIEKGHSMLHSFREHHLTQVTEARELFAPPSNSWRHQLPDIAITEEMVAYHFLDNFDIERRKIDASLLFLVEPLGVLDDLQSHEVILDIEQFLVREHGIARYEGDTYWGPRFKDTMQIGERTSTGPGRIEKRNLKAAGIAMTKTEAQWTLFDPLLSAYWGKMFLKTGQTAARTKQLAYLNRSLNQLVLMPDGQLKLPEAFYYDYAADRLGDKHTRWVPNDHVPLLWSQANLLRALLVFEATRVQH